jgi:hypothetical protein
MDGIRKSARVPKRERLDRRGFFRRVGRGILLAVLAVLSGWVGWRRTNGTPDPDCLPEVVCAGCPALASCRLPQAQDYQTRHNPY